MKTTARLHAALTLVLMTSLAHAGVTYIDAEISWDCESYNVQSRRCFTGDAKAYASLSSATTSAQPGDVFQLRGGNYVGTLHLTVSGTKDAPIRYEAYPGEKPLLTGASYEDGEDYGPIWFDNVSHNQVSGLEVRGNVGFLRAINSHHNLIENSIFEDATTYPSASKRGGIYLFASTHNTLRGNRIIRGTDNLSLVKSHHNRVIDNVIEDAGHDVWNIKCGSYNVLRGNHFANPRQKAGSVFDCEHGTMAWVGNSTLADAKPIVNDTRRNLIEHNTFALAADYYSTSGGNGIQYAGQEGIIRHNVFYKNNVGLAMVHYEPEALYNHGNRVYHNTFHANFCGGISIMGADALGKVRDNQYVNNILWDNLGWDFDGSCDAKDPGQIVFRGALFAGHEMRGNLVASPLGNKIVRQEFGLGWTVEDVAAEAEFRQVIEANPEFADEKGHNYRLTEGSPAIDAGVPLTTIRSPDGESAQVEVADASYFYDGFGIDGEQGDEIQVGRQVVRIIGVDYDNNVLILARPISWQQGAGVSLPFAGSAPDPGAFEAGL